jgi:GNAT superfamily N-acetyltransferase
MEWHNGDYTLTDEPGRLDFSAICRLLADTYWAANRPPEFIARALQHSISLGLFQHGQQVGFCRAVSDEATFTWICDVIVDPAHRARGLGKWMVSTLLGHPRLQTGSQVLATRDAHSLYERFGFQREEFLKRKLEVYGKAPPQ